MKQNIWCKLFNLHKYEILKEEDLKDNKDNKIGIVIISRCVNCGKIRTTKIYTETGHERY